MVGVVCVLRLYVGEGDFHSGGAPEVVVVAGWVYYLLLGDLSCSPLLFWGGGWDGMFVLFFCGGPMAFLLTSLCRSLVSYDRKEEMRSVHRGGWDFGSVFWISFHLS